MFPEPWRASYAHPERWTLSDTAEELRLRAMQTASAILADVESVTGVSLKAISPLPSIDVQIKVDWGDGLLSDCAGFCVRDVEEHLVEIRLMPIFDDDWGLAESLDQVMRHELAHWLVQLDWENPTGDHDERWALYAAFMGVNHLPHYGYQSMSQIEARQMLLKLVLAQRAKG